MSLRERTHPGLGTLMSRRKPAHRKIRAELLASSNRGKHSQIFDADEVRELLREAVEQEGSQVAFAKRHGVERTQINLVLNKKRDPSANLLKILGLKKAYAPE